jgi:hypothetical protein
MLIEDFEKFTAENGLKTKEDFKKPTLRTLGILIDNEDTEAEIDIKDLPETGLLEDPSQNDEEQVDCEKYNTLIGDIDCNSQEENNAE